MAEIFDLEIVDASNTTRWPEGMLGSAINNSARALEGLLARWYEDTDGSLTSGGSANAYTLTSKRTIAALVNNTVMVFTANFANTGAATLAFNGLTAKSIKRPNGDALVANDIVSGQVVIVIYKSSPDEWRLLSAPAQHIVPARAYGEYTTNADITTAIPIDDTIPQNTEGDEILSVAITLKRSDSRVRAIFRGWGQCEVNSLDDDSRWSAALFRSSADALAAAACNGPKNNASEGQGNSGHLVLAHEEAPGSVGPHTYTVRVGPPSSSTLRMNGSMTARFFGGVAKSTLVLEEVFV